MSTMPWLLRPPAGGRQSIHRALGGSPDIDAWLDTLHRLAQRRHDERIRLESRARAARARRTGG